MPEHGNSWSLSLHCATDCERPAAGNAGRVRVFDQEFCELRADKNRLGDLRDPYVDKCFKFWVSCC